MKSKSVNFLFSLKGYLIVVFVLCLIMMPVCEYYLHITFSKVFPLIIAYTWLIGKAIYKDKTDKTKILFDFLIAAAVTAFCLYLI